MGQLLVKQLGLDRSTDTLSRWMAHRIAELISTGEADESRRAEATDLILRVWERRGAWPEGWPPRSMERVLMWLDPHRVTPQTTTHSPWSRRLVAVDETLREEFRLWLTLALLHATDLDAAATDEQELLDAVLDRMSLPERRLAELLRQRSDWTRFLPDLDPDGSPVERADEARKAFAQLLAQRMDLFEAAVAEVVSDDDPPEATT